MRPCATLAGPPLDLQTFPALTLGALLAHCCERAPDDEALVFDDPLHDGLTFRWTYRDLAERSGRFAKALVASGAEPGNRVGVLMANRPEAVAAVFGAALAGTVVVPLSTFSTTSELSRLLEQADLSVLVLQTTLGGRRLAEEIAELCPGAVGRGRSTAGGAHPRLRTVAALGPAEDAAGITSWDELMSAGSFSGDDELATRGSGVRPSDPAVIVFSSGTTARAKGVLHSHRAVAIQWWTQAQLFGRDRSTRLWCAMPLFWTAGLVVALGATIAGGGTWVMQETFEPGLALRLLERERVTEPHVFAHQARALEEHAAWSTADLSSCTKVFGKSVFTRHPSVDGDPHWNMPIGYGLSETGSFFTGLPSTSSRAELRNGSYGRLLPGNELRVIEAETGRCLGPGEEGELIVRGPTLMECYVGKGPPASLDADGFHHTGDVGSYDAEGYVYFRGRKNDMIKTAGANVSPAEIEVHLHAYEPVRLARAVGVPDDLRDEIVVLCVELKDGAQVTEDDVVAFLRDRVASYKVPRRVLFFGPGEIPMNGSGMKVKDERLISLARERMASKG